MSVGTDAFPRLLQHAGRPPGCCTLHAARRTQHASPGPPIKGPRPPHAPHSLSNALAVCCPPLAVIHSERLHCIHFRHTPSLSHTHTHTHTSVAEMNYELLSVPLPLCEDAQPISRTYQYRKVMKPMLERKRRARINRCLDELKELMVTALQSEGENVSKLEKADILELTVRHLHKLRRQQRLAANPVIDADRFRAGFTHCANEVSRCLAATPGVDVQLGTQLMTHLGHRLNEMDKKTPLRVQIGNAYTPPGTPTPPDAGLLLSTTTTTTTTTSCGNASAASSAYPMPLTPASSTSSRFAPSPSGSSSQPIDCSTTTGLLKVAEEPVWRPW